MPLSLRRILLLAVMLVLSAAVMLAQAEKVYVTKTGSKYHRASCSSLSRSKIEMSLAQAAARYGACKNCKPPVLKTAPVTAAAVAPSAKSPAVERAAPVVGGRCQATTKKGTQCSRKAQAGRSYCWQH